MVLHLPLIYVMGRCLDIRYVNRLSRLTLILVIPMTILIVDQFYSPQSALVNVGGRGGWGLRGFAGALDRFSASWNFHFYQRAGVFPIHWRRHAFSFSF